MKSCIENFINGNLTDAKEQAKKFSLRKVIYYLINDRGYSVEKAAVTAKFLKGIGTFQDACDAV